MKLTHFSKAGRHIGIALSAAFVMGIALAQHAPDLTGALTDFTSPDPAVRIRAFDDLLSLSPQKNNSVPSELSALLRQYPDQADRIKTALIAALEKDAEYRNSLESNHRGMSEPFSDYWSNLMWAVGTLRDDRAVKGLLGGVDTGGIAVNALADLCPFAVDDLIAESRREETESSRRRAAAVNALGECMKRSQAMDRKGMPSEKVRAAALNAATDSDPAVREAAVGVLFYFRNDSEVRGNLARIATSDPYQNGYEAFRAKPGHLIVREAATAVLNAAYNDDSYYFVMRTTDTRLCSIQKGADRPAADRYIGPEMGGQDEARHMLCTHLDAGGSNPDLCWAAQPENICR